MSSPSQPLYTPPPFVGRQQEQKAYRQLLKAVSPWLLIVTGQGGNGKSTLLRQLAQQTPTDRAVATLNFANKDLLADPFKILETLAEQLSPYCSEQKYEMFESTLQEGRKLLAEISRTMSQTIYVGNDASLQGASLSMGGDAALMREQRLHIRAMVTKAFYTQIRTLNCPLVLLLDTCEWFNELEGQEVGQWMLDEILLGIHERVQQRGHMCSVVIASRVMLSLAAIEKREQWPLSLPMLEQAAVEQYLSTLGMEDAFLRQRVYEITHGHALCVSIIGVLWQEQHEQPFTLADLPYLQEKFNERALLEFIQERLARLYPNIVLLTRRKRAYPRDDQKARVEFSRPRAEKTTSTKRGRATHGVEQTRACPRRSATFCSTQAAWRMGSGCSSNSCCAKMVTSENRPSKAGVVRKIARSDHCRCISTPRCVRTS